MTVQPVPFDPTHNRMHQAGIDAERWRGSCISVMAVVEQRVCDLLLVGRELPAYRADKAMVPPLTGARFAKLRELQDRPGPLKANALDEHLDDYARFHALRGLLCHGAMTVGMTDDKGWQIGLEALQCGKQGPENHSIALTQDRAERLEQALRQSADRLKSTLGQIRRQLRGDTCEPATVAVAAPA